MKRINWQRVNAWRSIDRNERAWLRTYDAGLRTAQQVQKIGGAVLAIQRNVMILHARLQAVENRVGIKPSDPLIVVDEQRMDC